MCVGPNCPNDCHTVCKEDTRSTSVPGISTYNLLYHVSAQLHPGSIALEAQLQFNVLLQSTLSRRVTGEHTKM